MVFKELRTSFTCITASCLDGLPDIPDRRPIVKQEVGQYVVNTVEHKVGLCQAWSTAELIGIFKWHIELSGCT